MGGAESIINGFELEDLRNEDILIPFYFLLNFTDNEGIISGVTFKKLQEDFLAHPDQDLGEEWLNEQYELWKQFIVKSDCISFS